MIYKVTKNIYGLIAKSTSILPMMGFGVPS